MGLRHEHAKDADQSQCFYQIGRDAPPGFNLCCAREDLRRQLPDIGEQTLGCLTHRLALRRSGCRRVSTSANEVTVVTVGNAEGASIGAEPAGSIDFGLISPAIENPPA